MGGFGAGFSDSITEGFRKNPMNPMKDRNISNIKDAFNDKPADPQAAPDAPSRNEADNVKARNEARASMRNKRGSSSTFLTNGGGGTSTGSARKPVLGR